MAAPTGLQAISDNRNACTGLALAGVSSQMAHTPEELLLALENMDPDVGIVIITSGLAAKSADIIKKYREKNHMPLITIIPDSGKKTGVAGPL